MKKLLLTLMLLAAAATSAVAQGRLLFGNDSVHPIVMGANLMRILDADAALGGRLVPGGALPSGLSLVAGLYATRSGA